MVFGSTGTPAARRGLGGGGAQPGTPAGLPGPEQTGRLCLRGQGACHTSPSQGCWAGVCSHHRPRKLGWRARKGSAVVAPPFMCHSTVVPWSQCGPRPCPHQHPRPSPTAVPSLDPLPESHSAAPSPPPYHETHRLGCEGLQHGPHAQASLHPAPPRHWLLHSPPILRSP